MLPPAPHKARITIRLDADVLVWFRDQVNRAGGGNYQSLINDALRGHIQRHEAPLEGHLAARDPRGAAQGGLTTVTAGTIGEITIG